MITKKRAGLLRRDDDFQTFKVWKFMSVTYARDGDGSRKIESELGDRRLADGRQIYTQDEIVFFIEGEPTRPLRMVPSKWKSRRQNPSE